MSEDLDFSLLDEIRSEEEEHLSPLGKIVLATLRWFREREGEPK